MGQRLALIIGNSIFLDNTLARLKTPEADVGALGDILLDPELGGFDDAKVLVNMSSHTVRREVAAFFSKKSREDLLLFYFSGHGVLDDRGRLYLAVKDTDSKLLRGTAIPAHFITDEMNNSRSRRQVLVLDCCHSGAFARGTKGQPGGSVGTAAAFEGTGYGRVVLTASDATQYAWEGDQVIGEAETSLFTHYLLQGIRSGEADANRDGKITVEELYDFVYERVVKQTPRQTPGKWSYKERGEIVISRAPALAEKPALPEIPETHRQMEERLEQLYNQGLGAYWTEAWEEAVRCFLAIVEVNPDYQDAQGKLEQSRHQLRLSGLRLKASAARDARDWDTVIQTLENLLRLEPDDRDSARTLEEARVLKKLADLYQEARRLYESSQWQAVVNVFGQIAALRADYPDPEGLLSAAEKELEAIQRQAGLERLYNQALQSMDAGSWSRARQLLLQLEGKEPGYKESQKLLERVENEVARLEEEKHRQVQIETLYEQTLELARARKWRQVLDKIADIQALDPHFPDPEGIAKRVEAEIALGEEEAQRHAELERMYGETHQLLEAEHYQEALEKLEEIQAMDPKYPDRQGIRKTAQKKLRSLDRDKAEKPRLPGWAAGIAGILVVGVVAVWVWNVFFSNTGSSPQLQTTSTVPEATSGLADATANLPEAISDQLVWVTIPAGEFVMGSPESDPDARSNEFPQHVVYLDSYEIGAYEVTNEQYNQCVQAGACSGSLREAEPNHPVENVNWFEAQVFCEWVGGRLPTEAEWEKAARGGLDGARYPWGNEDPTCERGAENGAQFSVCEGTTVPVASFAPNGYDLYDMAGNVWEWVVDRYDKYYYGVSPPENPQGPVSGDFRVLRGGGWDGGRSNLRPTDRLWDRPDDWVNSFGFRCARSSAQEAISTMPGVASDQMVWVTIPAGEFTMGSPESDPGAISDESPQHMVYLDAYEIGAYEVTNEQYASCVDVGVCDPPEFNSSYTRESYYDDPAFANYPVVFVTWFDAQTFCEWRGARLPTEAEWEKAARGAKGWIYPWGNAIEGNRVNFCDSNCEKDWANPDFNDGYQDTAPVGSYPVGANGLYDMAGNVWEWVADWYGEDYYSTLEDGVSNPTGPESGGSRVARGGSWTNDGDFIRSAKRNNFNPDLRGNNRGFRCASSP